MDTVQIQRELLNNRTAMASAQNAFGFQLLGQLTSGQQRRNVFLSPTSVFLALAMAEAGSAGDTRTAMRLTMSVPAGMDEGALRESTGALSRALRSRQQVELLIANALWAAPACRSRRITSNNAANGTTLRLQHWNLLSRMLQTPLMPGSS